MSRPDPMRSIVQTATTKLLAHCGVESGDDAGTEVRRLLKTERGRRLFEIFLLAEIKRRREAAGAEGPWQK